MRLRPPSLGFIYILLVLAGVGWFFTWLGKTPWYELEGAQKDLGEAAYLERLAPQMIGKDRKDWLHRSLGLYIDHADWPSVIHLLKMHKFYDYEPTARGIVELSQDEVWSFNFSADNWTTGHQPARFLVFNPKDRPQQNAFVWRTKGEGQARVDTGSGEWEPFQLEGEDWKEARVVMPTIPAYGFALYRFAADKGFAFPGKPRRLGLHLERIEFDL